MNEEKKQTAIIGNEIEEWAKWLDSQPRNTPISKDNFEIFFKLIMITNKKEDSERFEKELGDKLNAEKILISRFELFGYKISNIATLMICLMIEQFSPGNIVIYANYLAYKCKQNHWDGIDHDKVVKDLFPFGSFSNDTLNQAWQKQKSDINYAGNLLDNGPAGKSLHKDW